MKKGKGLHRRNTGGNTHTKISTLRRILKPRVSKPVPVALMGAVALLVGLDSYLLFSRSPVRSHPGDRLEALPPVLKITPEVYDFGTVSQAGGVVTGELTLENRGGSDLVITGIRTSCGCTQVSLVTTGETSILFGMHNTPLDWKARVAPREKAQLRVLYNPNVHSQLRGPVTRTIQIRSNDPEKRTYEVGVRAVQVE
ncbi:MAG: DUF1573 domain-containing protein [Fidelibacterota bacterium]